MGKINLKALSPERLSDFMSSEGLPAFRTRQLLHWIYERHAESIEGITVFSKALRASLMEKAHIGNLLLRERLSSCDGTEKFLFELEDGELIESVLIQDEDRLTLCVSSQAGCAMGCRFCRTGRDGLRRDLGAFEIVDQAIAAGRLVSPRKITNVVFMGMGEPLRNFQEVNDALWRMTGLLGFSKRRITVSTCGYVPGIRKLGGSAPDVGLAVSLNATTDAVRDSIMPINRRYPLRLLLDACRRYPLANRRRITFEYVLLAGINDGLEDARRLPVLLKGISCKVNLIPLNETEGHRFRSTSEDGVLTFQKVLADAGLTAIVRKSKGADVMAACGQLRGAAAKTAHLS